MGKLLGYRNTSGGPCIEPLVALTQGLGVQHMRVVGASGKRPGLEASH
jgi:hypothetical protein